MQSKCSCSHGCHPKAKSCNKQGQFLQIAINAAIEAFKFAKNLTLRAHNSEAYGDWTERRQKRFHRKDELRWPAHILTCSSHVLSHVLALNGTSLLAVTCPCKNQAGWPFWCPYRNVVFFSLEPCTRRPTLKSHRSKLGLRSTSSNATNHDSLAQVFPRITSATCIYFKFWLAHCIVFVLCDWPE